MSVAQATYPWRLPALSGVNQGQHPNLSDLNALIQKIAGRKTPDQNMPDRNLTPGVLSGIRSFIYGYPLVMMGITQRLTTNVSAPNQSGRAPKNQFSHATVLPDASYVDVQLPNVNSLYSLAGPFSFRLHNQNLIDETC